MAHHDSSTYPYIATAIVKGMWNVSEYPEELKEVFNEYSIDYKEVSEVYVDSIKF